jgi:hypothetical protein
MGASGQTRGLDSWIAELADEQHGAVDGRNFQGMAPGVLSAN